MVLCGEPLDGKTYTKTSKRVLNQNAIKFKLTKLKSTSIRYEVIYKNLVRDLRKFYSQDFNIVTQFMKKKKKQQQDCYLKFLRSYIEDKFSGKLEFMSLGIENIIFNLGSLIYPKEMLRILGEDSEEKL